MTLLCKKVRKFGDVGGSRTLGVSFSFSKREGTNRSFELSTSTCGVHRSLLVVLVNNNKYEGVSYVVCSWFYGVHLY